MVKPRELFGILRVLSLLTAQSTQAAEPEQAGKQEPSNEELVKQSGSQLSRSLE
jgi:hypothetical protein